MRIPYETMAAEFARVLEARGFRQEDARTAGEIFAQNSLAGVHGHGLLRFPRLVNYLEKGELFLSLNEEVGIAKGIHFSLGEKDTESAFAASGHSYKNYVIRGFAHSISPIGQGQWSQSP